MAEPEGQLDMTNSSETETMETERIIHYPRGATIFAAVACIIFILVGIVGKCSEIVVELATSVWVFDGAFALH